MGKNTGKNFSEGWVEFEDKKVAKQVAAMLNGNPMGGKRRSAYHYDLWCLKYLPKFKWDHLSEEIGAHVLRRFGCNQSPRGFWCNFFLIVNTVFCTACYFRASELSSYHG